MRMRRQAASAVLKHSCHRYYTTHARGVRTHDLRIRCACCSSKPRSATASRSNSQRPAPSRSVLSSAVRVHPSNQSPSPACAGLKPSLSDKPLRAHPTARPPAPSASRTHALCALRMTRSVRSPRCAMPTPSRGRRSSAHYSRPDGTGARVRRQRGTHRLAAALAKRSSAVPTQRKALRCRQ
jgi:hypothetical protein